MNRFLSSRLVTATAALAFMLGAAACDSQGCGGEPEEGKAKAAPEITCGAGTRLLAGQCVVVESGGARP